MMATHTKLTPVHPGEVLLEEFLIPMELSQSSVARSIGVSPRRINEIVHGTRRMTADTAVSLSLFFGNSAAFWMGLQMDYELDSVLDSEGDALAQEVIPLPKSG